MGAHFTVEDIRLINLHYGLAKDESSSPNEELGDDTIPVPVEILCNSNYDEKTRLLKVSVSATIKNPRPTFNLSAEVGGLFQLDPELAKEDLINVRHINCPGILFPYLREVISEITRRGGFDPVYLPPMNFADLYIQSKTQS